MAIYDFRTNTYARNIYIYGETTETRFTNIPAEYVEPVKQKAAAVYSEDEIHNAHTNEWITQPEYDDTVAYKYPTEGTETAPTE
ncbi:hypothetical protein M3221_13450 [Domibacillus indicus]|uniref:hypothetical protein n=1 Tax=Domibacillus indicus TaxID=1437523 RepID=UPI00203DB8F0|nr:hypothetical protein [Domibacillus indicus]MCM3789406.1 hypothetical protein [Domibacillus indicus]